MKIVSRSATDSCLGDKLLVFMTGHDLKVIKDSVDASVLVAKQTPSLAYTLKDLVRIQKELEEDD